MLEQVLFFIHHGTTMLFGILISAFLLGVKANRKNIFLLFALFCCEGSTYIISCLAFGQAFSNQIYPMVYPLIIHLPLVLFLFFYYKYPILSCCTAVFSAYMCCQFSNWIGIFVLSFTQLQWCYYLARILATVTAFFLLYRFICPTTEALLAKSKKEVCILGFSPFIYYLFDYAGTKFSSLLYSGSKVFVEFMSFVFCITYLVFLLLYFREYEQIQEAKQYNELMKIQVLSIQNEIDCVKNATQNLSILRHDMRHHLNLIYTLLQKEEKQQAIDYISKIITAYDNTIVVTYCKNEMVNSILSIYQTRFTEQRLRLDCSIRCESPVFSELAFCAILSNALENAMYALQSVEEEEKWAKLTISKKENHLLLQLKNPTSKIPKFIDGVPVSNQAGHGIGVKSTIYYVKQLNGQWHFSVSGHCFLLRIII